MSDTITRLNELLVFTVENRICDCDVCKLAKAELQSMVDKLVVTKSIMQAIEHPDAKQELVRLICLRQA